MKPITVDKAKLLETVLENRAKHRTVFEAALVGWHAEALRMLDANKQALLGGKLPLNRNGNDLYLSLTRPTDHTRDYDRVIHMIEMELGATFTLTEQDFAQYVDDDWAWKRQWASVSNAYAAASYTAAYGAAPDDDDE